MREVKLEELTKKIDPIVEARNSCFLVTATDGTTVNTLTAGWFMLGNNWEKKVAAVFIRPQRHTKKFIDASGRFTLSFFENHNDALMYLGTHSGADVPDKIEKSGLHLTQIDGQPAYEEAKYTLICKAIYVQPVLPENFIDPELPKQMYPDEDYSIQYVAEIEKVYEAE